MLTEHFVFVLLHGPVRARMLQLDVLTVQREHINLEMWLHAAHH